MEKENGAKRIFKEMIAKNFSNLAKDMSLNIQEV
jgi:hypothetical protein